MINPLEYLFGIEGYAGSDRNLEPGYNNELLRLILGDPYSACPIRQFNTLPVLSHSRVVLQSPYPKV